VDLAATDVTDPSRHYGTGVLPPPSGDKRTSVSPNISACRAGAMEPVSASVVPHLTGLVSNSPQQRPGADLT
jgi:hypothetical protein